MHKNKDLAQCQTENSGLFFSFLLSSISMRLFSEFLSSVDISWTAVKLRICSQDELHLAVFASQYAATVFDYLLETRCLCSTSQFMVEDFGISEQYNATFVGLLASTFFFCQFATSILWGAASDKYGRRPCLLWGVALNGLAMVQFGFSSSFGLAVLGRALAGGLSGNVAISKSYLGEVTSGSRSAKGFGLLGFVWGIGSVTAPMAGGYLSNPTSRYPGVFPGDKFPVLVDFPYLLPSAVSAVVALVALTTGLFYLPETPAFLERAAVTAPRAGPCEVAAHTISSALKWFQPSRRQQYHSLATTTIPVGAAAQAAPCTAAEVEMQPVGAGSTAAISPVQDSGHMGLGSAAPAQAASVPQLHLGAPPPEPRRLRCCSCSAWLLSRGISNATALCIASYACVAMAQVLFDELMPIFAKTSGSSGGLSFDSGQVGLVLTMQGAALIVYQPVFFPIIVQRVGAVRLFFISALLLVPVFFFFPALTLAYDAPAVLWPALAVAIVAKACLLANMFTGILMLTNRSARGANLGKVNGVSQSSSAAVRSVSPFVGGVLYSVSTGLPGRLHAMLPYALPTCVLFVCAWLSNKIPASLNFEEEDPVAEAAPAVPDPTGADDTKGLLEPTKQGGGDSPLGGDQPQAQFAQVVAGDPDVSDAALTQHVL